MSENKCPKCGHGFEITWKAADNYIAQSQESYRKTLETRQKICVELIKRGYIASMFQGDILVEGNVSNDVYEEVRRVCGEQ